MKKLISFVLVLSMIVCALITPASFNASTNAQEYLESQMESFDINGVVYVTKNGEVVCQSARGMANT